MSKKLITSILLLVITLSSLDVFGNELTSINREGIETVKPISSNVNDVTKTTVTSTTTVQTSTTLTPTTTVTKTESISSAKTTISPKKISANVVVKKVTKSGTITEVSSYHIQEYKKALNVTKIVITKPEAVKELMRRKVISKNNYRNIITISRVAERVEDKEIVAGELLEMDQVFVNKLGENIEDEPKIKEQVRNYVQAVKLKIRPRVEVEDDNIQELFSREITIDDLIDQIWEKA